MTELPKQLPTIRTFEAGVSRRVVTAGIATLGAAISASKANALNNTSLQQAAPNQGEPVAPSASGSSALVSFQQSGPAATIRTVQSKNRDILNLSDFLPFNHTTNGSITYTSEVAAAAAEAIASRRELVLPGGTYFTAQPITASTGAGQQLRMRGAGSENTFLRNADGSVLNISGQFFQITDMALWSQGGGATIKQSGLVAQSWFERVAFVQDSPNQSIWDNQGFEYVDNRVHHFVAQHSTSATVPAIKLLGAGGTINDNSWSDGRFQNGGFVHFIDIGTTTANAQYANRFAHITCEVLLGGGFKLRSLNGFVIDDVQNWDADAVPIRNHFVELESVSGIGCIGVIRDCGRWAGSMAVGKYDVKLPSGGLGAGVEIHNCRTAGGGYPFTVDAANNAVVFSGIRSLCSVLNNAGQCGIDSTQGLVLGGLKVAGSRDTGWTAMRGMGSKGALAATPAGTASAAYVQAELQRALNRIAALEARLKSYDAALIAHGLIGA